jgi:hypothetical protein
MPPNLSKLDIKKENKTKKEKENRENFQTL